MNHLKEFTSIFEKAAYGLTWATVFSDFLQMCICAFSGGKMEEEYFKALNPYKDSDRRFRFPELLVPVVMATKEAMEGNTWADILGEFYQLNISNGRNGQFFTPANLCDFMTVITGEKGAKGKRVCDPCCGSGRMLLSFNAKFPGNKVYGYDNDLVCARMSVVNLYLHGCSGEVAWMDSLKMEFYQGWQINPCYTVAQENSEVWIMFNNTFIPLVKGSINFKYYLL